MRVLLVEPQTDRATKMEAFLDAQNFAVDVVGSGRDALPKADDRGFCVIIIPAALPDMSALELTHEIRQADISTPLIVVCENHTPEESTALLDAGADAVLARPIEPAELVAHIRSLQRRCEPGASAVLKFEDLELDLNSLEVRRRDEAIPFTSREVAVLEYLMRHPQRVVTREELADHVWGREIPPESNVIEVFIVRLRRKIDKPYDVPLIQTMVGRGYMLSVSKPGYARAVNETTGLTT